MNARIISITCLILSIWVIVPVNGHIHSHKVHIEKDRLTLSTWIYALLSSAAVGACGVFPLFVNRWIKLDRECKQNWAFRGVLCFAVGGLLGDVFLHLLPEAFGDPERDKFIGVWVIGGLLTFLVIEKIVKYTEIKGSSESQISDPKNYSAHGPIQTPLELNFNSSNATNGSLRARVMDHSKNGFVKTNMQKQLKDEHRKSTSKLGDFLKKDITGYLNLVANCTDNFTHGLAIAASYVASPMVGLLTTLAILCHEIPHEIGDFAILINSGFSQKEAAKAQIVTATGGLFGVVAGLTAEYLSSVSSWLLPFTAGGFLYIALVSIVPEILDGLSLKHLIVELVSLGVGIIVMAMVTIVEKKSCNYVPEHYFSV